MQNKRSCEKEGEKEEEKKKSKEKTKTNSNERFPRGSSAVVGNSLRDNGSQRDVHLELAHKKPSIQIQWVAALIPGKTKSRFYYRSSLRQAQMREETFPAFISMLWVSSPFSAACGH